MGEHNELKNRYMQIGYSQVAGTHTSMNDVVSTQSENIKRLVIKKECKEDRRKSGCNRLVSRVTANKKSARGERFNYRR